MKRLYQTYFSLLGVVALFSGLCEILVAAAGHKIDIPIVAFTEEYFRGIWGGLVMVFAGVFYARGVRDFGEVHQLAKVFIGSTLVWIMAGTDLFALVAASIPSAEDDRWINTAPEMLKALAPPYSPAVILLPFSLLIIPCLRRLQKRPDAGTEDRLASSAYERLSCGSPASSPGGEAGQGRSLNME